MNQTETIPVPRAWPDYRAVWRWHFYAGLICIPFVVVLSISGSIYLFKEEIESWIDRSRDQLVVQGKPASAADQARAALAAVPGSTLQAYELPREADDAVRVVVSDAGKAKRVYLHPETLAILHVVPEEERFMRILFKLHGELLMGNRGSAIVEIASSWTIVLILTGLYLWWPRGSSRLGGVLYPRLNRGSRILWRDIHGVSGLWISGLALFLLVTGLPWAKFWGDYFKTARRLTGTAVARQDWTNGSSEHEGHAPKSGTGRVRKAGAPVDLAMLDKITASVRPLDLPPPVLIAPPGAKSFDGSSSEWTAKSMTANRPRRVDLVMDGKTGAVKNRKDFADRHLIDRIVGTGVAAHEGRLFGLPNQLLGLITAAGLVLLCVSSVVLWWRRREAGTLGAPLTLTPPRFSAGLIFLVVLLGIYLPLFGATLLGVLIFDRTLLHRLPRVRDWLGMGDSVGSGIVA